MVRFSTLLLAVFLASLAIRGQAAAQDTGELRVSLQLDRRLLEPGSAIVFTVSVQNVTGAPLTVIFPTSQRFDVVMRSARGEVARWSSGMSFTQAISRQSWSVGEVVTFTDAWIPRTELAPTPIGLGSTVVPRGLLTLQAELTGLTLKPTSRPETIVIGTAVLLEAGCTTLPDTVSADTPVGVMELVVEPFTALQAFWQPATLPGGGSGYRAYAASYASVTNLQTVRRNVPLTVCLNAPARITLP